MAARAEFVLVLVGLSAELRGSTSRLAASRTRRPVPPVTGFCEPAAAGTDGIHAGAEPSSPTNSR